MKVLIKQQILHMIAQRSYGGLICISRFEAVGKPEWIEEPFFRIQVLTFEHY